MNVIGSVINWLLAVSLFVYRIEEGCEDISTAVRRFSEPNMSIPLHILHRFITIEGDGCGNDQCEDLLNSCVSHCLRFKKMIKWIESSMIEK